MRRWVILPALLVALAACEAGEDQDIEESVEETLEEIDEVTGVDTLEGPGAAGPADQRVVVQATSYAYQPSRIDVAPGTVRFVITNAADIVHGFEVEGQGMEEAIEEIQPGTTDSLTVRLDQPGEYEIYCPVDDHRQRGMTGRLIVERPTP